MAEVVLSPLIDSIIERLTSGLFEVMKRLRGIEEDETQKLHHTMRMIQAVLEDAEELQGTSKALKVWLTELKEIAYDADDWLEEQQATRLIRIIPQVCPKLKLIRERLDGLAADMSNFNLESRLIDRNGEGEERRRRETGSFVFQAEVLGRDGEKETIIEILLSTCQSERNEGNLCVIPIVGLGGIGKTTLAQLLYNDDRVTRNFEQKTWVSVNNCFDVQKIMKSILQSATRKRKNCEVSDVDCVQYQLQDLLFGRKFLLVLDDVWNEDPDEWDKLRVLLKSGAQGSRVIVTTRSEKVALIMGTMPSQHLKGLCDDDCWELFKQRAFANDHGEYPSLLTTGKEIVKKCRGVPLAAKTLGSLMRFKRTPEEWLSVQNNDLWNVCGIENGILPALRLSYSHFPSQLKTCFAYCSLFPEGYVIKREKLIHMWIAEGLIQSYSNKSVEDVGNDYFNDLIWMSFFQDVVRSTNGDVLECKIHPLIHELARHIAGDEYVLLEHGHIPRNIAKVRHASVVCDFGSHIIPEALFEAKNLRTLLLLFPKVDLKEVPVKWFSSFRRLRVLDLSGSGIRKLHSSISSLKFLRYLDLSNTLLEALPEALFSLHKLQVLNLSGCSNLIGLPNRLNASSSSLRHLIIKDCPRLTHWSFKELPRGLQTLPIFILNSNWSLRHLAGLSLKGELTIKHLENVKHAISAEAANLRSKPDLNSLGLSWGNGLQDKLSHVTVDVEMVLECLKPSQNLKCLSVIGYPGICFPKWMHAFELPNLVKIVLINCRRCEYLPSLGDLPFLEVIIMQGMDSVKKIGSELYGENTGKLFASLKELALIDFPNLEFWWNINGGGEFPSLVSLKISRCPKLINMPCFPSLQSLELSKCHELVLRSAMNLTSLSNLVIDVLVGRLVLLGNLLQNNCLLLSLTISSCPKLQFIPSNLGNLNCLKSLTIRWCEELVSLPMEIQNLASLDSLEISECHSLSALPESIGGLRSLRILSIENCSGIISLPSGLQTLRALERFTVMYCQNLASLPSHWQNLSALRSLCILNCPTLSSLPEGLKHVTSMQSLEIRSCNGLRRLPEWISNFKFLRSLAISGCNNIKSLPQGLQCIRTLQHLSIQECPSLEERCKKGNQDWPKIAHIAHIYIGSLELPDQNAASSSSR